jgi:N-acetylglutamate synthase-like GNAT family acetyltransferase
MKVQRADIKDIESILYVINKSNGEAYSKIIPSKYFKKPVITLDELSEEFKCMSFYTYKLENKVVGTAALKVEKDKIGTIRWVYILPEHQRKGIGTSLIRFIEKEARKIKLEKLMIPYVHEKAHWARNFYEKLGYKMVGRRPRPWGDDVIYEKLLKT